jgi:dephospho-CoA kinase
MLLIMAERTILQITGQPGAGKSDVSRHLVKEHEFTRVLVSDIIRAYAIPRGLPTKERFDFRNAHTKMLAELGEHIIVQTIMDTPSDRIAVDGIRVPAHSENLRAVGSKIIAIHCPSGIRYARVVGRQGVFDQTSYEEFLHDEALESRNPDPFIQSTLTVMESADFAIDGSQPHRIVNRNVDAIVAQVLDLS